MLGGLGMPELLVIGFIVIMIFGIGKLPKIGKDLGEGLINFRKALQPPKDDADDKQ